MMPRFAHSIRWRNIVAGVRQICRIGWVMAEFEYRQAEEIRDAFARHHCQYLFIGKSGAILLGFPDTTQDVDLFPARTLENGRAIIAALHDLGFTLTATEKGEI